MVELAVFAEKNAKRIRILKMSSLQSLLKMVGFAEKNFSYQKNGNSENGRVGSLRREKFQLPKEYAF